MPFALYGLFLTSLKIKEDGKNEKKKIIEQIVRYWFLIHALFWIGCPIDFLIRYSSFMGTEIMFLPGGVLALVCVMLTSKRRDARILSIYILWLYSIIFAFLQIVFISVGSPKIGIAWISFAITLINFGLLLLKLRNDVFE